jgi:hypothetical protein
MPSNTPIQALAVMNDPAFHECAQALGQRMEAEFEGTLEDRISKGYRAATSKRITADRLPKLVSLYHDLKETYESDSELKSDIARTPEGAALAIVGSVILNLDEATNR